MTRRLFLYILSVFTLLGCENSDNRFILEGEFAHLEQGEFFVYSDDGGNSRIDTIRLAGGEFRYEIPLTERATFYLLYPNFTEQVVFAAPGEKVSIKGDARELRKTEVKGSRENELMTEFRLGCIGLNAGQTTERAAQFIRENPESYVSVYLLKEYFLKDIDGGDGSGGSEGNGSAGSSDGGSGNGSGSGVKDGNATDSRKDADGKKDASGKSRESTAKELYALLMERQPDNLKLIMWGGLVNADHKVTAKGRMLPESELMTSEGDTISTSSLRGKHTLICFWASWESSATSVMAHVRRLRRDAGDSLKIVTVSLDTDKRQKKSMENVDTVTWTSCCDYRGWQSEAVRAFNVKDIPFAVFAAPDGKIISAGHDLQNDVIKSIEETLKLK